MGLVLVRYPLAGVVIDGGDGCLHGVGGLLLPAVRELGLGICALVEENARVTLLLLRRCSEA